MWLDVQPVQNGPPQLGDLFLRHPATLETGAARPSWAWVVQALAGATQHWRKTGKSLQCLCAISASPAARHLCQYETHVHHAPQEARYWSNGIEIIYGRPCWN